VRLNVHPLYDDADGPSVTRDPDLADRYVVIALERLRCNLPEDPAIVNAIRTVINAAAVLKIITGSLCQW